MKVVSALALFLLACSSIAFAQSKNASLADDRFVRAALLSGTQEIAQGGKYSDASDANVHVFAARMVKDHSTANVELLALARQLDITVPDGTLPASGAQEQPKGVESPPVTGAANGIDAKRYFETQVADHKKAIALFQKEIADGSNAQIKAFAKKTLPTLEAHLSLAEKDLKAAAH